MTDKIDIKDQIVDGRRRFYAKKNLLPNAMIVDSERFLDMLTDSVVYANMKTFIKNDAYGLVGHLGDMLVLTTSKPDILEFFSFPYLAVRRQEFIGIYNTSEIWDDFKPEPLNNNPEFSNAVTNFRNELASNSAIVAAEFKARREIGDYNASSHAQRFLNNSMVKRRENSNAWKNKNEQDKKGLDDKIKSKSKDK
jgi:hypothetical protein